MAVYRYSVVSLIPLFLGLAIWVITTTNSNQIAIAQVIERVASLEDVNAQQIESQKQADKERTDRRVDIVSRLTKLETNNANLTKAVDRLVTLIDERLPQLPKAPK